MKKIGFIVQVLTLITALPLLSILELNHVNEKTAKKNNGGYLIVPELKKSVTLNNNNSNGGTSVTLKNITNKRQG